mmetsp:Transcript_24801/g.59043  ORF Transcript_24801/g.59043 Transcript_24801/m.59043 type:complete len:228 (-) Transcript_24801:562-1245(-)
MPRQDLLQLLHEGAVVEEKAVHRSRFFFGRRALLPGVDACAVGRAAAGREDLTGSPPEGKVLRQISGLARGLLGLPFLELPAVLPGDGPQLTREVGFCGLQRVGNGHDPPGLLDDFLRAHVGVPFQGPDGTPDGLQGALVQSKEGRVLSRPANIPPRLRLQLRLRRLSIGPDDLALRVRRWRGLGRLFSVLLRRRSGGLADGRLQPGIPHELIGHFLFQAGTEVRTG